jgi:hypothetical protein
MFTLCWLKSITKSAILAKKNLTGICDAWKLCITVNKADLSATGITGSNTVHSLIMSLLLALFWGSGGPDPTQRSVKCLADSMGGGEII